MSLIDLVQQHLGPDQIQQISQQIGADPATTQTAVQAALPMLLGGMANHAQQSAGAESVDAAVQQHAGLFGGLGGGLGGILGGALGGGSAGGILGSILGQHEPTVTNGVQQASGLDSGAVKKLLVVLAPIVLAALAHQRSQQQQSAAPTPVSPADLQHEAQQAQAQVQRTAPHVGGLVGKILDAAMKR